MSQKRADSIAAERKQGKFFLLIFALEKHITSGCSRKAELLRNLMSLLLADAQGISKFIKTAEFCSKELPLGEEEKNRELLKQRMTAKLYIQKSVLLMPFKKTMQGKAIHLNESNQHSGKYCQYSPRRYWLLIAH